MERLKPSIKVEETLRGQIAKFLRGNDSSEDYQIEFIDDCDEPAEQQPHLAQPAGAPAGKLITVTGFNFPIADEDTVELLEATVNEDEVVRKEYISFLRQKKPKYVGILNVFHTLFLDEAMYSYNFSGICNRGPGRKAMQNYSIFVDCMLEAWADHGIDRSSLKDSLNQIIKNINGRKRNRKYFAKRKVAKIASRR
ncbi:uncharacterized protein LOC128092983 [Culex pipiens pallens]|uniref:uncharacterized protein LOC128092983 n=1 Tax=Culex pipiens pallens TaxID=42434 RepID=UPI0022AAA94C|nr:uncharacterized protein LOC128092983 [Culex pipiens pallens]